MATSDTTAPAGTWRLVRHRWPALLGLTAAVLQLVFSPTRETAAIVVSIAALCYLGAAALGRPWVAWAVIPVASVVVTVAKLTGVPWWIGLGLTGLGLVVVGLLLRVPRPALTAQTMALIGYGGLAVAALLLAPRAGLVLVGLVLASHGIWDTVHFRRRAVVPRPMAEACMLLDVPLGLGIVLMAVVG